MPSPINHPSTTSPVGVLHANMQKALQLLLEARECAEDVREDAWQFAVEMPALLEAGCTRSALRWLVARGLVVSAVEKTRRGAKSRSFGRGSKLSFSDRTCFTLTSSGIATAKALRPISATGTSTASVAKDLRPRWDAEMRELWLGDSLVKAFKQPAPNQETILAAFDEDGWPPRIDNPLSPPPDDDGKRRLHDAITRLNRHQKNALLHFRSDNNGDGVRWEFATSATPKRR